MQLSMAQIPAWPRTKEKRCDEGHSDTKKKGCGWRNSEPEEKETGIVTDVDSLTASADRLAEKAASSRDMSILVKSNAMHKAFKEKTAEMTELDKQLADKLLEQKNCE